MAEITQVIPDYDGTPPNRFDHLEDEFSDNADYFAAYFASTPTDYNTFATQVNSVRAETNGFKDDAAASAGLAESYADLAADTANFKGAWSGLAGSLNTPAVVGHDGVNWQLLTNLADVTLSEPSITNPDWLFQSGTKWIQITADSTAYANGQYFVYAVTGDVDITQSTFAPNDFVVISNSSESTDAVRLLNPSNTIKGNSGTASAGDNIVLKAGETIHIVARTSSILGVIN